MIGSRRPSETGGSESSWSSSSCAPSTTKSVRPSSSGGAPTLLLRRRARSEFGIDGGTAQVGRHLSTLLLEPARPALGLALL